MSIHVIDQGAETPTTATAGDIVLRRDGSEVEVASVTDAGAEWVGRVPADALPLEEGGEALDIAARGVESALANRGA